MTDPTFTADQLIANAFALYGIDKVTAVGAFFGQSPMTVAQGAARVTTWLGGLTPKNQAVMDATAQPSTGDVLVRQVGGKFAAAQAPTIPGAVLTGMGAGSTPQWGLASLTARQQSFPGEVDQSWHTILTGDGAAASSRASGGGGAVDLSQTAAGLALLASPALGFFDQTFAVTVASADAGTCIFGVRGANQVSPQWIVAALYTAGSPGSVLLLYQGTGGVVTVATFSAVVGTSYWRIRHDANGWHVAQMSGSGLGATVTQEASWTRVLMAPVVTYSLYNVVLGDVAGQTQALNATYSAIKLNKRPADSMGGFYGSGQLEGPPVGASRHDDATLASEIVRLFDIALIPTGSSPLVGPTFYPGAVSYGNLDYVWDHAWWVPFWRDLGGIADNRASANNFIACVESGTGRIANIIKGADGTIQDNNGSGRPWCQGYISQIVYWLAHDGDLTWLHGGASAGYTVLKGNITWIENHRQTGRGLFTIDATDEVGWDGNRGANPLRWGSGSSAGAAKRYESVILSSNMYSEYQAMAAIATQLGHTSDATAYAAKAAALATAIQTLLWSETDQWLENYDTVGSALTGVYSADVVHALFAGCLTSEQTNVILDRLMDPAHFLRPFGITSLDTTDAYYITSGVTASVSGGPWSTNWNGGIWEPVQWMAAWAAWRAGRTSDAFEIAARCLKVYRANYNVPTSAAAGAPGEWQNPETGIADTASTGLPFIGWGLGARLWVDLANGYDSMRINPATTIQQLGSYSR